MGILFLQFAILAALIVCAGTLLAKAADEIGRLTGLGGTLAGFFLLAGATSLPELVIDCNAAVIGAADLALGDLLGSSLFNLLILGVIDLTHRSSVRILSPISAAHALSATASIVLTGLVLVSIILPQEFEFLQIGGSLWLVAVAYMFLVRLIYYDRRIAQQLESTLEIDQPDQDKALRNNVLQFCGAAVLVLVCGPSLASVADRLAEETGLGGTFVGTIFVAMTTSLPEIITTLVAVRMGAFELAVGNVFGSNCFNIAILPIVDLFYQPGPIMQVVATNHVLTASCVIVVTAVATIGLLYRAEKRYWFFEPDALMVVMLSVLSLAAIMLFNGM